MLDGSAAWGNYTVQFSEGVFQVNGPSTSYAETMRLHAEALLHTSEFKALENLAKERTLEAIGMLFRLPSDSKPKRAREKPSPRQLEFAQNIGSPVSDEMDKYEVGFFLDRYSKTRDFLVDVWKVHCNRHPYDSGIDRDQLDETTKELYLNPNLYVRIAALLMVDPDESWKTLGPQRGAQGRYEGFGRSSAEIVDDVWQLLSERWKPAQPEPVSELVQRVRSKQGCALILCLLPSSFGATLIVVRLLWMR